MDCDSAIDVRGLSKSYGRVRALSNLTLRVRRGEAFGFLGPNGAGKTTSVKLLAGLARADGGTGSLLGLRLGDRRARKQLGYLPELFRYPEWLCGREVLRFHARICGRADAARGIDGALEMVGLTDRADDRVATYSKGMQQRLGLAVALLGDPQLVILDEPTSALDPSGRLEVREILRRLRARGTTIFLNSHLLTEVEQICDRIAVVASGRVVAQGTIGEILGAQTGVRIRARADGTPLQQILERFGPVVSEREYVVVQGVPEDAVPAVVRALAQADAAVFSVEPIGTTLEQRFLELTSERA